jgi:hypothetical protein
MEDKILSKHFFQQAADFGHPNSLLTMAELCHHGIRVVFDYSKKYHFAEITIFRGDIG